MFESFRPVLSSYFFMGPPVAVALVLTLSVGHTAFSQPAGTTVSTGYSPFSVSTTAPHVYGSICAWAQDTRDIRGPKPHHFRNGLPSP